MLRDAFRGSRETEVKVSSICCYSYVALVKIDIVILRLRLALSLSDLAFSCDPTTMADSGPRKRQRVIRACIPCRQMKRKCDGERPCLTCARFQHDCQYQQQKMASPRNVVWSGGGGGGVTRSSMSIAANEATATPTHTPGATKNSPRENESMDYSILDPEKGRYFDASSAIAFPRLLGIQFGANKAPRLHSFAWNLGIRTEPLYGGR
jgi:Fungal Zn(2)-Cys(6) binuclear cluster domain